MILRGVAVVWRPGWPGGWPFTSICPFFFAPDVLILRTIIACDTAFRAFSFQNIDRPTTAPQTITIPTPFESFASNCLSTSSGTLTPPPQGSRTAYRALYDDRVSV